jgi:ankyrin repeat protein
MLVERGADVTAQNNDGSTPLNPATRKGQVDAARLFIERGVDVTAQNVNNSRETPTTITSGVNSIIFHPDVSSEYAARILLKYGVHVNAQNKNVLTPLRLAQQASSRKLNASLSGMVLISVLTTT